MRDRWVSVAVAAVLLFAAPVRAADDVAVADLARAGTLLGKADRALKTGNASKAEELYRKALEVVPDHPEGYLGLGHIHMQRREFEEARAAFDRARVSYRSMSGAVRELREQRYREAQDQLVRERQRQIELTTSIQRAESGSLTETLPLEDDPDGGSNAGRPGVPGAPPPRRFTAVGTPQPSVGGLESQLRAVERRIEQLEAIEPPDLDDEDPVPGEVHFFLGNALLNLDRFDDAIEQWERCAEKNPRFPWVHNNLAVAYWKRMDIPRAVESMERAESLGFPVSPDFKRDLLESYRFFLAALEAAVESSPP